MNRRWPRSSCRETHRAVITSFTADDGSLYAFFFKLSALNVSSRHRARHDMCVHTNAAYLAHAYIDVCTHERTHARTVHVLCARAQAVCTHAHLGHSHTLSLTITHVLRREKRALAEPHSPDAIKLRWLWSRCVTLCEREGLSPDDGRVGDCDGQRSSGPRWAHTRSWPRFGAFG